MADGIEVSTNADMVAHALLAKGIETAGKAHVVAMHYGAILKTNVQRRASLPRTGPPGPRLITGDYVRSMHLRTTRQVEGSTATVGTNAPQARRLEFGFNDTDSRGRRYNQPPYPHWGPALDETAPAFVAAIAAIVGDD